MCWQQKLMHFACEKLSRLMHLTSRIRATQSVYTWSLCVTLCHVDSNDLHAIAHMPNCDLNEGGEHNAMQRDAHVLPTVC